MRNIGYLPHFEIHDYLVENHNPMTAGVYGNQTVEGKDDFRLKTDCFYMMKYEHVYGTLTLKKDHLFFEPLLDSPHNEHLDFDEHSKKRDLQKFEAVIDYLDIIEANKMNLVNENAVVSENTFIREAYKFDIFIQVVLTAVNGVTLKADHENQMEGAQLSDSNEAEILRRNSVPIANMYFKMAHKIKGQKHKRSEQESFLPNHYEERVADEFLTTMEKQIKTCKKCK
mmetsp:Transcript_1973/g.3465  ORF Transcript_1973/g.3465 Transcript_1973/m.3465 type:complete len:227 (-) Transcript_1973:859-1539(-)